MQEFQEWIERDLLLLLQRGIVEVLMAGGLHRARDESLGVVKSDTQVDLLQVEPTLDVFTVELEIGARDLFAN